MNINYVIKINYSNAGKNKDFLLDFGPIIYYIFIY